MEQFVINRMKTRIDVVQRWSRVLLSPQDRTALNIVQNNVKLVQLIGEPAVVDENVWSFPPLNLSGDANGFAGRQVCIEDGWWPRIRRLQLTHPKSKQTKADPKKMNRL